MPLPVPDLTRTPLAPLKAMVFPAPATVPPMVLFEALSVEPMGELKRTPLRPLPTATVPVESVPM